MKKFIFALILMFSVGCSTGYKAANTKSTIDGYEEMKVADGVYRVKYQGGNHSSLQVYQWFLRRSAELSKENGYKYFDVEEASEGYTTRGMQNIGAGEVRLPKYEGTVRMTKDKGSRGFDVDQILANSK